MDTKLLDGNNNENLQNTNLKYGSNNTNLQNTNIKYGSNIENLQNTNLRHGFNNENLQSSNLKFCKFCGEKINMDAVICTKCGRQVEELKVSSQPNIIINNDNSSKNMNANVNANMVGGHMGIPKKKIVSLLLCFFLGWLGAHKFYEGKAVRGIIYLFTFGLLGVGILIDLLRLLAKPSVYYV